MTQPHLPYDATFWEAVKEVVRRRGLSFLSSSSFSPLHRLLTRNAASIFMLHRFQDPDRGVQGHDPAVLRDFLAWLRKREFPLLRLDQLIRRIRNGESLKGCISFTVDDGYCDFATIGAPVFAEFECPVTVFLPTAFIDGERSMWWDEVHYLISEAETRIVSLPVPGEEDGSRMWSLSEEEDDKEVVRWITRCLRRLGSDARDQFISELACAVNVARPERLDELRYQPLEWGRIRELESDRITFGPHTHTHPWLPALKPKEAECEIKQSWQRLQTELRAPMPVFCVPYGMKDSFGAREQGIVRNIDELKGAVSAVPSMVIGAQPDSVSREIVYNLPRFGFSDCLVEAQQVATGIIRLRR